MTARDDQKQRTHQSILASAIRLLRKRGIGGASAADAMRGANLTVGGFYAHFAPKEALVDEALRRDATEVRALLFSRFDSNRQIEYAA